MSNSDANHTCVRQCVESESDRVAVNPDQPVGNERFEPTDEPRAQEPERIRFALAKQPLDHSPAPPVVLVPCDSSFDGQQPGRYLDPVAAGVLLVLDEQVRELADRACAEADQHFGAIVGEALEIALSLMLPVGGLCFCWRAAR